MIIDGEKWACEACVRGHRVSNCQHTDRPLQHINKKGRPVSQCSHCRAMRKSRSSHVKCDCGEKTSKCAHLQPTVEGHTETCCCNHGGRCSCSPKEAQSQLDTVPEFDSEAEARFKATASRAKLATRRRRANTVHSDAMFSFDQNGNRITKTARASQKIGPYQLNRVNSATSTTSLATDSMADGRRGAAAQRRVKSEATSPMLSNSGFPMNAAIPPLDLSSINHPPLVPSGTSGTFDLFGASFSPEHDQPLFSAGLSGASVDWSHYDFNGDNFGPSSCSQAGTQNFGNFPDFASNSEHLPNLVNTTSNSGDVSEVEDFMPGTEADFNGSFVRQGLVGTAADLSTIDYDSFCKGNEQTPMPGAGMSMVEEDPAFWMPNYNEGLVDESPDPLGPTTASHFWDL